MLVSSGAEAVENAVKIARHATGRQATIAFEDAFHGRTLLALSLTSKVKPYKLGFGPYAPEIYRMPFAYCYRCAFGLEYPSCEIHCAYFMKEFFNTYISAENIAALIAEPVLGEGGLKFVRIMELFLLQMRFKRASAEPPRCLPWNIMMWHPISPSWPNPWAEGFLSVRSPERPN